MADKSGMNKMKGKAKEAAGKVTGNDRMESEGRADQAKAKAKDAMSNPKEKAAGMKDSLKDRDDS
ncbi:CsbD family protein [Streptomyces sp. NPDC017993]|uniref:CsbD family protein n=1 Tax=Streptomyces sp. NPDC017993 TaxID=3365027 RepID=UPI00378E7FCA